MKAVRALVSSSEGGRIVLVVTEHPMKKGTVLPGPDWRAGRDWRDWILRRDWRAGRESC